MSPPARRLRRPADDAGITLVELLVYSLLSVVVITMVGSMLIRTLVSQRDLRSVTEATTAAQLVAASVEGGVRNAAALRYAQSGADELLVVRSAHTDLAGTPTWWCQGWFYDATALTLYSRTESASAPDAPIVPPDAAGGHVGWTVLATGVRPGSAGLTVLAPVPGVSVGGVDLNISVQAGTRKPVEISTRVTQRPQGEAVSAPCF